MGGRASRVRYDQWDILALAQATGLQQQQVEDIYQDFIRTAGRDGQISKSEFAKFYKKFPSTDKQKSRDMNDQIVRVFRTFDRDGSGGLSFEEFLGVAIMMNHDMPRRDRIEFLIRENNAIGREQGDGRIPAEYGQEIFQHLDDYYGVPAGNDQQRWEEVDPENRGYVTQDELMNYISQQDAYTQQYKN
jgi:Ca2+-binding EF-hand superfamily protein